MTTTVAIAIAIPNPKPMNTHKVFRSLTSNEPIVSRRILCLDFGFSSILPAEVVAGATGAVRNVGNSSHLQPTVAAYRCLT